MGDAIEVGAKVWRKSGGSAMFVGKKRTGPGGEEAFCQWEESRNRPRSAWFLVSLLTTTPPPPRIVTGVYDE